ncbi:uncharacterized protein LOC132711898 [Pantherophis guttatus]|uniref:Uncharacterized protein LOC132711898 n=1 Tax=Pantherophis guttatus TaxID=94885 RepID=A0ABM3ZHF8_PANGU|nr:uncharacterized protein LOC132711898 [Pantherophis guttatus]
MTKGASRPKQKTRSAARQRERGRSQEEAGCLCGSRKSEARGRRSKGARRCARASSPPGQLRPGQLAVAAAWQPRLPAHPPRSHCNVTRRRSDDPRSLAWGPLPPCHFGWRPAAASSSRWASRLVGRASLMRFAELADKIRTSVASVSSQQQMFHSETGKPKLGIKAKCKHTEISQQSQINLSSQYRYMMHKLSYLLHLRECREID